MATFALARTLDQKRESRGSFRTGPLKRPFWFKSAGMELGLGHGRLVSPSSGQPFLPLLGFSRWPHFLPSLAGAWAEHFSLHVSTGELRTATPLRQADQGEYLFTVTASDRGAIRRSTAATLRIQVHAELLGNLLALSSSLGSFSSSSPNALPPPPSLHRWSLPAMFSPALKQPC